ncbi:hypothetical protein DRO64_05050 [Candidatus Bathyarchaeota archaeon]|nr:MAG: hypothetical protein DRO64_05050 [Candidatus Bathyarchaeota archaeon]HDM88625.1 hypothetical protein [Candidatus Bathyarchaeota archaeon]
MIIKKIMEWHVIFMGFKNVKISNLNSFLDEIKDAASDCQVQVFDADRIAGFDHLYFSVLNALNSFESGNRISESPAMEIMLYASGQHQIRKAIDMLGVKPDSSRMIVVLLAKNKEEGIQAASRISESDRGEPDDGVIELTDEKFELIKALFRVSDEEIEAAFRGSEKKALTSILIERSALLAAMK